MSKQRSEVGNRGLMNLNGNVLCSIDCETTGLTAGHHDLIEFACVPLAADLKPMRDVLPFSTLIRPKRRFSDSIDPGAMKVNGIKLEDLAIHGLDGWRAAELFVQWIERLQLTPGKKIAPLATNWPFDKGFVMDWLGPKTFDFFFWHRYRDTQPVVLWFNDRAEFEGKDPPFPQSGLQEVRASLGIPVQLAHRALDDALTTASVYRKLMEVQPFVL